jgi:hypothetical protein
MQGNIRGGGNVDKEMDVQAIYYLYSTVPNGRMFGEHCTGRDLETNSLGLIEVLSLHFLGRTEENHKEPWSG